MITSDDRVLTNRERRAAWASRYLLSGNEMFSGFLGERAAKAFAREFEVCAAADLRDVCNWMEGYEHDRY